VLPQWRKHARIQRLRMQVAGGGAVIAAVAGVASLLLDHAPNWLPYFCLIAFVAQVIGCLADGHLYRQRLADVAELEAIIAALESGEPGS
jgi:hypothetical protein